MGSRIGVMGGTFDPIHIGHLVTAEEALQRFELEVVYFVPAGHPWMKEDRVVAPGESRFQMTVIATASNPSFEVMKSELEREGPTHTVDTLRQLRSTLGDSELFFITGADAILDIHSWQEPEEVMRLAHVIAATRPGYDIAAFKGSEDVAVMDIPALAISSTDIRARVKQGRPIRYLVPEGVRTYIEKTGLYR